ncbi:MAG: DNA/RNA helicase, partial [Spirochaetales bacterium]
GNIRLGRIDINANSSDVQVDAAMAARVEEALAGYTYQGTTIRVERVDDQGPATGKRGAPRKQYGKSRRPNDRPGGRKGKPRRS